MSNVVAFPGRGEDTGPTLEGPVRCLRCKHEWHAVGPVGVYEDFECPKCTTNHGVRIGLLGPHDGNVWACNCGNQLFILTPTRAPMCALCGLRATSWAEG